MLSNYLKKEKNKTNKTNLVLIIEGKKANFYDSQTLTKKFSYSTKYINQEELSTRSLFQTNKIIKNYEQQLLQNYINLEENYN